MRTIQLYDFSKSEGMEFTKCFINTNTLREYDTRELVNINPLFTLRIQDDKFLKHIKTFKGLNYFVAIK